MWDNIELQKDQKEKKVNIKNNYRQWLLDVKMKQNN